MDGPEVLNRCRAIIHEKRPSIFSHSTPKTILLALETFHFELNGSFESPKSVILGAMKYFNETISVLKFAFFIKSEPKPNFPGYISTFNENFHIAVTSLTKTKIQPEP